jgi:hypothetical protein
VEAAGVVTLLICEEDDDVRAACGHGGSISDRAREKPTRPAGHAGFFGI